MPYSLTNADAEKISVALRKYYEEAFDDGVRGAMDKMARKNMGVLHELADIANDTYLSLKKKSNDSFGRTFESKVNSEIKLYFANKNDVMKDVISVAKAALGKLIEAIPIPLVATIVSEVVDLASSSAQSELHRRAIKEADAVLNVQGSRDFYTEDTEIAELVANLVKNYKLFGKYLSSVPLAAKSFDEVVTLPGAVFKMQATASTIAIGLSQVREYLNAMEDRLIDVRKNVEEYKDQLKIKLPDSIRYVLIDVYNKNLARGNLEVVAQKYALISKPVFTQPEHEGGATLLAAHIAYASAIGYYDAGVNIKAGNRFETSAVVRPSSQTLSFTNGGRR